MNTPSTLIALCASVMFLVGCERTLTDSPTPQVSTPVQTEPGTTAGLSVDPSVPSAESANAPLEASARLDPTPLRPDGTRAPKQESIPTLLPGQNNDHSAPLAPAAGASSQ